ncbi:MAG: transposase [Isosphaeraceae bacterium]|nr:transposase [Isosphaeraceae bacterium]
MIPPESRTDLPWLAFRYVCGELDDRESAAFEARLDHDQAAREAVAEAVELIGAVVSAPRGLAGTVPVLSRRQRWGRVLAASVLAAAACWGGLAVSRLFRSNTPTVADSLPSSRSDGEVALTWSGLRRAGEHEERDAFLSWIEEGSAALESEPAAAADLVAEDQPLPSWLLEVATLQEASLSDANDPQGN